MRSPEVRTIALAVWLSIAGFDVAAQALGQQVYQVVFLKRNPARPTLPKEEGDRIQAAHMANIKAMAARGVLVAAGPFEDTPPVISGVFIFVTATLQEARELAAADPTVRERRNTVGALTWRGPAGIGEKYKRLHKDKPDTPEGMGVHPLVILRRAPGQLSEALRAEHDAYWAKLRGAGKVLATGAVEGDASAVQMLIFERIPDAEAANLTALDPAVAQGALKAEIHRWWSAAHVFPR